MIQSYLGCLAAFATCWAVQFGLSRWREHRRAALIHDAFEIMRQRQEFCERINHEFADGRGPAGCTCLMDDEPENPALEKVLIFDADCPLHGEIVVRLGLLKSANSDPQS